MNKLLLSALVAGSLGAAGGAEALPLPSAPMAAQAQAAAPEAPVVPVAGGCGIGWHRGPWGGCRPNWGYYNGYRPWGWGWGHCWWRPGPFGPVRVCN
ncbi:GCG_CRPN prefix-to-repeats domain-containing protein [Xanthobacter sediminis]